MLHELAAIERERERGERATQLVERAIRRGGIMLNANSRQAGRQAQMTFRNGGEGKNAHDFSRPTVRRDTHRNTNAHAHTNAI